MIQKDHNPPPVVEWKAWLIWSCAALFFGYQFALRVSPSVMADELMLTFGLEAHVLGLLMAFYYNAYATFQIPAGSLLDRFGPRKMLICALTSCLLGCFLFGSAESIFWAAAGRLFIGAGSAFGFLSCLKIATTWFTPQRLPFVLGVSVCFGTFGAISGSAPLSLLVTAVGWRSTIWWLASGGVLLLGLIFLFVKEAPPIAQERSFSQQEESPPFWKSILMIATRSQTWLIAIYGLLMYVPLSAFADLWGVKFLTAVYRIDKITAAQVISNIYIGMGIGSLFFPPLCQRFKAYRPGLFISAFMTTFLFIILLAYPTLPLWLLSVLLFALGCAVAGQFLSFSVICELNPRQVSATAAGFQNMISMMSGVIFQPLVGYLLYFLSTQTGVYTPSDYIWAVSVIPCVTFAAFFLVFWMQEVYPRPNLTPEGLIPKKL